ncbi:MAG: DbpA RNA binding domain-containing protein [Treponema sp.]|jgi:RNA recognition motif-containing protein|nr:DbpA RNA binding domain-containing protein [Treponema sp.]
MSFQFDSARLKKRIAEALDKTYSQVDPKLLSQYRSIFKKEVSFFRRSYFTAYLLMELDQGGDGRYGGLRERNSRKFQKTAQERDDGNRQEIRKVLPSLPEEESVRLFIGIGRSRRVFPREILGLIVSKTSVSRDDIGAIRIFDNYSFVQVRTAAVDEIIEALNGKPFRGRSLVVNYARSRKDEKSLAEERADDPAADTGGSPEDGDYAETEDTGSWEEESIAEETGEESSVQEDDDHPDKEGV